MKSTSIGGRNYSFLLPYIIAEIGVNHEGSMERAKRMIEGVAESGAHAAKFQTYKAEKIATPASSPAYWDRSEEAADSQFALFKRWDNFSDDDYRELAAHCRKHGVDFLSTPFDLDAVDLLRPMVPAFKVASADITNIPLLRKIGGAGLPVIMSVGAARLDEVAVAIQELRGLGAESITLLHCVLNYPTAPEKAQLAQIPALSKVFGDECAIGYSDHVKPDEDGAMPALEMATLFGCVVIEKHFTDDKTARGNDHYHAMDRHDLRAFVDRIAGYRKLFGSPERNLAAEASAIDNARRRIVAARDIAEGETLAAKDLIPLRSNVGIEIARWDNVVGRQVSRVIASGAPLEWTDLR